MIHPLAMRAENVRGKVTEALAINEVSLLRQGPQAAKLRVSIDGRVRLEELVCDGALVATPAGSTAYNYSAHGPILPIGSDVLALTAMSAFRPRRWRGALLPSSAVVRLEVIEGEVAGLRMVGGVVVGVVLASGMELSSGRVVLTAGTFLNGVIHIGDQRMSGGRMGDSPSRLLAAQLAELALPVGRLKTGTPPRLDGRTIDWARLESAPSRWCDSYGF